MADGFAQLGEDTLLLFLQDATDFCCFVLSALRKGCFGRRAGCLPAVAQVGQQLCDIAADRRAEEGGGLLRDCVRRARPQGLFEQLEGAGFGLAGVRFQSVAALLRFYPAGRDGEDLLVKPRRSRAIDRQPAEQCHAGDVVLALCQTGT